jgi:hypothetical protein
MMLGEGSQDVFKDGYGNVVNNDVWALGEPSNSGASPDAVVVTGETVAVYSMVSQALEDISETCNGGLLECSAACQYSAPTGTYGLNFRLPPAINVLIQIIDYRCEDGRLISGDPKLRDDFKVQTPSSFPAVKREIILI